MFRSVLTLFAAVALSTSPAQAKAAEDPVQDVVIPLFDAVLAEDLARVKPMLADDAQLYAMFDPTGATGEGSVRQFPLIAYFNIVTRNYENIAFVDRSYSVADNGRTVWMEANGDLRVAATGKPYLNRYVFKISLNDEGKVHEIKEWVNTVTLNEQGISAR